MSSDLHLAGLSANILHDEIVPARAPWLHHVAKGQTLRIVDLEGNQAVDFLVYAPPTMPSAIRRRIPWPHRATCSCAPAPRSCPTKGAR
jgi:uncharacterized protein YcgI (DUF1989 family)